VAAFRDGVVADTGDAQKLERVLKLPSAFRIQKANVLLLRVTVPMDFYTSPITIEIEGVDVRLKVLGTERPDKTTQSRKEGMTAEDAEVVPNAVDLAQSFLETQPRSERKKLEEALAAETQDLGASLSAMSDDGSNSEDDFGTGQPLSLPGFLADFLRGVVDRMQVRIGGVTFQLDVEVPVEPHATTPEPVTFQIALEKIDIEGVTVQAPEDDGDRKIVPKEGKRHISLANVRAYLISEANVFSALARSPSMSSPAVSQSPSLLERSPPSRQTTSLSQSMQDSYLSDPGDPFDGDHPLQDSEDAFNIPYELGAQIEEAEEDNPATPRASIYQDFAHAPHLPVSHSAHATYEDDEPVQWGSLQRESRSEPTLPAAPIAQDSTAHGVRTPEGSQHAISSSGPLATETEEDLTKSHVFSHEEAESMYMSAFSEAPEQSVRVSMPGAWDESPESSPHAPRVVRQISPPPPPPVEDTKQTPDFEPEEEAQPQPEEAAPAEESAEHATEEASVQPEDSVVMEERPEPRSPVLQDDVPTPRGPTRLVKEILSLNNVSVYVPSQHQHITVAQGNQGGQSHISMTTSGLERSLAPQLPGAFSVHSTSPPANRMRPFVSEAPTSQRDDAIEVILSPIEVRFDMSLGFLLAMVLSRLLEAAKPLTEPPTKTSGTKASTEGSPLPDIKISAEQISLQFLHHLGGQVDTAERVLDPSAFHSRQDVLLRAVLDNINLSLKSVKSTMETTINLERFRFGYVNDDIVSFDRNSHIEASIKDGFRPVGTDVSVRIVKTATCIQTHVETLPLHIAIDLQRLDETFSWFGGLSSFLSMGSSMTSSASASIRSASPTQPKPRGVRFDTAIDPDDKSVASSNKANVRIGGFNLELIGKECTVGLETTAIKMVNREEGLGVSVTRIRLAGPYLRSSRAEPPINVELQGTRLEYLSSPKDKDLETLLALVAPSKVKFDQDNDDIMVHTLLRQRNRGPLLRVTVESLTGRGGQMQQLSYLPNLGEEIARLATVAKYLPDDERPGLLTLGKIHNIGVGLDFGGKLGTVHAAMKEFAFAHITIPSLVAVAVGSVSVNRNQKEELVGSHSTSAETASSESPVFRARMIGDEIEPIIKLKMQDMSFEYRVPTMMDVLGLVEDATPQDFEAALAASVADLGDRAQTALARQTPRAIAKSGSLDSKPMTVDLRFGDCLLGLNPLGLTSKLTIALTDAHLAVTIPKNVDMKAVLHISKASILLIDDISNFTSKDVRPASRRRPTDSSQQVDDLCARGFVNISYISSAKAVVNVKAGIEEGEKHVDVELRDDLLVLETCADSTQTLIALSNALKPPTPPSKENKFRTNVMPVQDLLASISAEAFGKAEGDYDFDNDFAIAQELGGDDEYLFDEAISDESQLDIDSQFYGGVPEGEALFDAGESMISTASTARGDSAPVPFPEMSTAGSSSSNVSSDEGELVIHENYFAPRSADEGTAKVWNSTRNSYDKAPEALVKKSPLKVTIRDVHVIWNLFDGYDWTRTKEVITKAVQAVEEKAYERRARADRLAVYEEEIEDEETIGDFLFNSIYIGIPANRDPASLAQAINQELNDNATETESIATTAFTATTRAGGQHRSRGKKLRLNRSKHHKVTFELKGINVDLVAFPPESGETLNSIDVKIQNLDIFDHVPTSTWKKFATYDQDAGEREMDTSMVHLQVVNVRPIANLAASEIVVKARVLPLRLHVDQDALDFITRFFEFKDESVPIHSSPSDVPFLQRVEVLDVPVKLDFKPKRVDYAGLRSGHTTEFMNFIILDEAKMVLRHTIIYGVRGFDRLGKTLNDIWMPDVKRNQLPTILAGLAPVRSIVNVGSGFRDLIEIPIREYKKDGRIVRSISKGAYAFARTTGTELVKLGAKVAIGTQYVLQGAEGMLTSPTRPAAAQGEGNWSDDDVDAEERKQISLYADQPTGVVQGLRGGYASLTRDLNVARDAIIAVPGEVMESRGAQGAAAAVLRRAPTIIFRPAIGATKAIGQTLMGATNSLDPQNRRRVEEVSFTFLVLELQVVADSRQKYKKH
jgi:autophagy-related protein 2